MKTLKQFLVSMALTALALMNMAMATAPAFAQDSTGLLPLPQSGTAGSYIKLPTVGSGTAEAKFYNLVQAIITNVRYILGAVAIAFMVYAGIRMVFAQGGEEEYTTQKRNIIYAIIGLAVVGLSGELVRIFSVYCENGKDLAGQPCTAGGFLSGPNAITRSATLFNEQTQAIITFIKYIIGSIAVFSVIRSGLRLITSAGSEEHIAEDKKALFYGVLGLIFIIMADSVVTNVFYNIDVTKYPGVGGATPAFNPAQGVKEMAGITNLVVTIATPVAILMLLYGAFLYISSAGKEEQQGKAKRLIFAVIVGILIMYAAFAIVSTIISGSFQGGAGTVTQPTGQT